MRVSDYTKNISEPLFSPGMTVSPHNSRNRRSDLRKSANIVKSLFSEIKNEKERTKSIDKEIKEIKGFMARLRQKIDQRK